MVSRSLGGEKRHSNPPDEDDFSPVRSSTSLCVCVCLYIRSLLHPRRRQQRSRKPNPVLLLLLLIRDLRGAIIVAGRKNFATEVKQSLEAEIKKKGGGGRRREDAEGRAVTEGNSGGGGRKGGRVPTVIRVTKPSFSLRAGSTFRSCRARRRSSLCSPCLNKAHN